MSAGPWLRAGCFGKKRREGLENSEVLEVRPEMEEAQTIARVEWFGGAIEG
jgi:hypothetical protein